MRLRRLPLRLLLAVLRSFRHVKRRTIHIMLEENAGPRQIARGCAIGMFIAGVPIFFFQMITAAFVATYVRANRLAAVTFVWATNPVSLWVQYAIGKRLLELARLPAPNLPALSSGQVVPFIVKAPLAMLATTIGAVPVGLISGAITYGVALRVVSRYQKSAPTEKARREARRKLRADARDKAGAEKMQEANTGSLNGIAETSA